MDNTTKMVILVAMKIALFVGLSALLVFHIWVLAKTVEVLLMGPSAALGVRPTSTDTYGFYQRQAILVSIVIGIIIALMVVVYKFKFEWLKFLGLSALIFLPTVLGGLAVEPEHKEADYFAYVMQTFENTHPGEVKYIKTFPIWIYCYEDDYWPTEDAKYYISVKNFRDEFIAGGVAFDKETKKHFVFFEKVYWVIYPVWKVKEVEILEWNNKIQLDLYYQDNTWYFRYYDYYDTWQENLLYERSSDLIGAYELFGYTNAGVIAGMHTVTAMGHAHAHIWDVFFFMFLEDDIGGGWLGSDLLGYGNYTVVQDPPYHLSKAYEYWGEGFYILGGVIFPPSPYGWLKGAGCGHWAIRQ